MGVSIKLSIFIPKVVCNRGVSHFEWFNKPNRNLKIINTLK